MSETPSTPPGVPAVPAPIPPGPPGYPAPPFVPRQNGLAVACLVLGIISLACSQCITAIPGVILGHVALRQIRDSRGADTGRGMAISGLVCGYISIGVTLLVIVGYVLLIVLGLGAAAFSA